MNFRYMYMSSHSGEERVDHSRGSKREPHVLIAEDDKEFRRLLTDYFEKGGFEVTDCPDGTCLFTRTAGSILDITKPEVNLIISDVRMPGYTGIEFLARLNDLQWKIPVILITAFGDDETHKRALDLGAYAMVNKPFEIEELLRLARQALGKISFNRYLEE